MFDIRLPDCSRLVKNRKNDNDVTICRHDIIVIFFFFWRFFVSLVKCSYWSKFHVNITASSEIQKSEIPASELCPISGDWDWLLNAAKCQSYNFYHFWVIKRKPTGWGEGVKKNSKIVSLAPNFISWRRPEIC